MKRRAPLLVLSAALVLCSANACGGGRDVVPETHDVHGVEKPADNNGGYDYVAKRSLATVALAEARGIPKDVAAKAIDVVADQMDGCEKDQQAAGKLVPGAVRIVALVDDRGTIGGLNISKLSQKEAAGSAILCLIAPIRLLVFPPAPEDAGAGQERGIAVEATWGVASSP